MHLYPYGSTGSNSVGYITIEIERLNSRITQHHVRYKSFFLTDRNKEFYLTPVSHVFNEGREIGWLFHMQKGNFFTDEGIIIVGDSLTFKCEMATSQIKGIEVFSQTELVGPVAGE